VLAAGWLEEHGEILNSLHFLWSISSFVSSGVIRRCSVVVGGVSSSRQTALQETSHVDDPLVPEDYSFRSTVYPWPISRILAKVAVLGTFVRKKSISSRQTIITFTSMEDHSDAYIWTESS
jgi:hypothetical protein